MMASMLLICGMQLLAVFVQPRLAIGSRTLSRLSQLLQRLILRNLMPWMLVMMGCWVAELCESLVVAILQIKDQRLLNSWTEKLSHLGDGLRWVSHGGVGVATKRHRLISIGFCYWHSPILELYGLICSTLILLQEKSFWG